MHITRPFADEWLPLEAVFHYFTTTDKACPPYLTEHVLLGSMTMEELLEPLEFHNFRAAFDHLRSIWMEAYEAQLRKKQEKEQEKEQTPVTKHAKKKKGVTSKQRRTTPKKLIIDLKDNEPQPIVEKEKETKQ
jgi:hypothetical protein